MGGEALALWKEVGEWTERILFAVLALIGFLHLLGHLISGLHEFRWSRWIFGLFGIHSEKTIDGKANELCYSLVRKFYKELGFVRPFAEVQAQNSWWPLFVEGGKDRPEFRLMQLLVRHIHKYLSPLKYGHDPYKASYYYINTMEASLDEGSCRLMCQLLGDLMHWNNFEQPDFVLVPKDGNALLAAEWTKVHAFSLALLVRGQRDPARAIFGDQQADAAGNRGLVSGPIMDNVEGLRRLVNQSKRGDRKLRGAVIDCNASGGSQVLKIMEEFNANIEQWAEGKIEAVNAAFILYRIDAFDPIDETFKSKGCSVYRWFDLATGDQVKEKMWQVKSNWENGDLKNPKVLRRRINELLECLEEGQ